MPTDCKKERSALDDVLEAFTLQQTRTSYRSCVHFDSVRGAHDENIGPAHKESAFDHTGSPIQPHFKSSGIIDPSHVQIQDVMA